MLDVFLADSVLVYDFTLCKVIVSVILMRYEDFFVSKEPVESPDYKRKFRFYY